MRSVSEAPRQPQRGLFGVVPPGRPTDLAVVVLVGVVQLALTSLAAHRQPERQALDLVAYLLLAVGPVALFWRWRSPALVLGWSWRPACSTSPSGTRTDRRGWR